jgi:outer membrane lipoprotein-sorting protein
MLNARRRKFLLFGLAATTVLVAPRALMAAATTPDRVFIARIEAYLNAISTMRASFLQIASTGELARGTFYLRRPGRLRIEYAPPSPVLIVADGHRLTYYDKELETANVAPIDDTLAGFLARERISFDGDVTITAFARDRGTARITVARRAEPEGGSLTLVFDDSPIRLRQWDVTDPQGVRTRVALEAPEFGTALADSLFEVSEPD